MPRSDSFAGTLFFRPEWEDYLELPGASRSLRATKALQQTLQYQPEGWRNDENSLSREEQAFTRFRRSPQDPDVHDRSLVLELLGRINYKILRGNRVYIEVGGVVYKTLYGAYWRSVFTGIEHYQLKCEEISGSIWTEGSDATAVVDLPIDYSNEGWTARGHSLSFMLSRD